MLPHDGKEILYVDDEQTALKYFQQLFGSEFKITVADSGEAAWEYIQHNSDRIAVLITDQRMGTLSGVELMERVRSRYDTIVRVLITAYTQLDYAVKSVNEGGAFRYLTKPFVEEEMIGTLMRACDFHHLICQRNQLLKEKLSVLHRLIVMDRVRGLALAVTALNGQIRSAWSAFESYIDQAPVEHRLKLQMDDLADLNILSISKKESRVMIDTITDVVRQSIGKSTGNADNVDIAEIIREVSEQTANDLLENDLDLEISNQSNRPIPSDAGMLAQLVQTLIRRIADIQDQPAKITVGCRQSDSQTTLEIRGHFRPLSEEQYASLFSATVPLSKWPIGMDMDILSAFLIAHHLGGRMRVEHEPPAGPGFHITLPHDHPKDHAADNDSAVSNESLDKIFNYLNAWELVAD